MTWYTGMCGSNGHGLTIQVSFMVSVCMWGLWIQWFMTNDAAIPSVFKHTRGFISSSAVEVCLA